VIHQAIKCVESSIDVNQYLHRHAKTDYPNTSSKTTNPKLQKGYKSTKKENPAVNIGIEPMT
jgi:hypothetical protein